MKLTPPKVHTFWIAVILGALGIAAHFGMISGLAAYAFWLLTIGFVLLVLAVLVKGL